MAFTGTPPANPPVLVAGVKRTSTVSAYGKGSGSGGGTTCIAASNCRPSANDTSSTPVNPIDVGHTSFTTISSSRPETSYDQGASSSSSIGAPSYHKADETAAAQAMLELVYTSPPSLDSSTQASPVGKTPTDDEAKENNSSPSAASEMIRHANAPQGSWTPYANVTTNGVGLVGNQPGIMGTPEQMQQGNGAWQAAAPAGGRPVTAMSDSDESDSEEEEEDEGELTGANLTDMDREKVKQQTIKSMKKKRNRRERLRWRKIRRGFNKLRENLPRGEFEELSQLVTLRRACRYIPYLARLASTGQDDPELAASVCEEMDDHSLYSLANRTGAGSGQQQQQQRQAHQQQQQTATTPSGPHPVVVTASRAAAAAALAVPVGPSPMQTQYHHPQMQHKDPGGPPDLHAAEHMPVMAQQHCMYCRSAQDHADNRLRICVDCSRGAHQNCHPSAAATMSSYPGQAWKCANCRVLPTHHPSSAVPPHQQTAMPGIYTIRHSVPELVHMPKDGAQVSAPVPRYIFAPPVGQPGMTQPVAIVNVHPAAAQGGMQLQAHAPHPGPMYPGAPVPRGVQMIPIPMASFNHHAAAPHQPCQQQRPTHPPTPPSSLHALPVLQPTSKPPTSSPVGAPVTTAARRPSTPKSHCSVISHASQDQHHSLQPADIMDLSKTETIALFDRLYEKTVEKLQLGVSSTVPSLTEGNAAASSHTLPVLDRVSAAQATPERMPIHQPGPPELIRQAPLRLSMETTDSGRLSQRGKARSARGVRSRLRSRSPLSRGAGRLPSMTPTPPLTVMLDETGPTGTGVKQHSSASSHRDGYTPSPPAAITEKWTSCVGCGGQSQFFCSQCRMVSYCSTECQERSWQIHCGSCVRKTNPAAQSESNSPGHAGGTMVRERSL